MKLHYRMLGILPVLLTLTHCSAPRPSSSLQNEVGQLNRQLQTLTVQTLALEQQDTLNKHSTSGVYLLPAAQSSAILQSAIGRLSVSLSQVEPEANGSQAVLHISLLDGTALPGFSAQVDWGQADPVSGKPLVGGMLTQTLDVESALLPKTQVQVAMRLSGLTPEQLGFVRLHQVTPHAAAPQR